MQPDANKQGGAIRMVYVGVDVGKSKCRAAMMSQEGKITEEFDFKNDSEGDIAFGLDAYGG